MRTNASLASAWLGVGLVVTVALSACRPTCGAMCSKLARCELTGEVNRRECEEACSRELTTARERDDRDTLRAFNERRVCVAATSCEGLDGGECFVDDGSFSFSGPQG